MARSFCKRAHVFTLSGQAGAPFGDTVNFFPELYFWDGGLHFARLHHWLPRINAVVRGHVVAGFGYIPHVVSVLFFCQFLHFFFFH